MPGEEQRHQVDLGGYAMQLRKRELQAVAEGLGASDLEAVTEALAAMPQGQRAPVWELAVRRFGHDKSLAKAAGEIGLDSLRAEALLADLRGHLATAGAR